MNLDDDGFNGLLGTRARTCSNASQHSQLSSKQNFPMLNYDSGLQSFSSNTSDCSLQLESDTDSYHQINKAGVLKDGALQLALQDVNKLRSELERLTKSEQWYKQELKQQKSTRLDDLQRIYTQERKFMQENQRLQKECVRLYEKCNELERELEKQNQEFQVHHVHHMNDEEYPEENILEFEKDQQLTVIKSQQQLISLLRKQKLSLLEDLKCLTEEKDGKCVEMQHLLADLEFENKLITKKCTQFAKDRLNLENDLKQSHNKLSIAEHDKMNLQKSLLDLKEQLDVQQQLLKLKENEIEQVQQQYTHKIQSEQDLDQVHKLSIKYQEELNAKTLEIIGLKERLQEIEDEMEDMRNLQEQNELQQRQVDQLNFTIETYRLELQELKTSEEHKNKQLDELHTAVGQLIKDKEQARISAAEEQNDYLRIKQELNSTKVQYEKLQELYKRTQFQLELLEIEKGKVKLQNDLDGREIEHLRNKLKEYLQQTNDLSNKIRYLENELARVLKENSELKQDSDQLHRLLEEMPHCPTDQKFSSDALNVQKSNGEGCESNNNPADEDFLEFQKQCENLQAKIDSIKDNQGHSTDGRFLDTLNDFVKNIRQVHKEDTKFFKDSTDSLRADNLEENRDFVNVCLQGEKLQENFGKLNEFLMEKQGIVSRINRIQESNEGNKVELVIENEIDEKKKCVTEVEALTIQIKDNINEATQKYACAMENLEKHTAKVADLQKNLLENDGKLYKLEKKLKRLEVVDEKLEELKLENTKLKIELSQQQGSKNELNAELVQENENLKTLRQALDELKSKQKPTKSEALQCLLEKNSTHEHCEVEKLKAHVVELQQQQKCFLESETYKREQRLQLLHQMLALQNEKMNTLQKHQNDWEDILKALSNAHSLEEKTRKDLELKRMELEELNQVFSEQNEELRKLEEFTAFLELKRKEEKEQLKQTFQKEIKAMRLQLQDCQQQIEKQKLINQQLEKQNERFQQDTNEDYTTEIAEYKNEIRELKARVCRIIEEKEVLVESIKEMRRDTKDLRHNKREAMLMPDFSLAKPLDTSANDSVEKQNINEDQLRILTKVLEAEYQRKMLRYDEHIHSLLSNLKSLKKSLKTNEEKTALLSEEQVRAKEELKDLQKVKRSLEEMRLKYEQSQQIINELKHSLALERKKFELSDLGKSSQIPTYEVSNLIDDYKKLIQQSAIATKRPSTSAIMDLIQRSNEYVPNLTKLGNNVEALRSELQHFLNSYSHKIPASSLIATSSLSVPPSLMDELRVASEGF